MMLVAVAVSPVLPSQPLRGVPGVADQQPQVLLALLLLQSQEAPGSKEPEGDSGHASWESRKGACGAHQPRSAGNTVGLGSAGESPRGAECLAAPPLRVLPAHTHREIQLRVAPGLGSPQMKPACGSSPALAGWEAGSAPAGGNPCCPIVSVTLGPSVFHINGNCKLT